MMSWKVLPLVAIVQQLHLAWAFTHMRGVGITSLVRHNSVELSACEDPPRGSDLDSEFEATRRRILGTVATFIGSSVCGGPTAASATTLILEDSEARRIDVFERSAPSVVFIDTFVEKQDAFSPNIMEVPLGSGSGFVWDKAGHIGEFSVQPDIVLLEKMRIC